MTLAAPRPLLVCADDFGAAAETSRVIAGLARAGRIGATSCITNAPAWRRLAPQLADTPGGFQCGLHLNLSEGVPLSPALLRHWPRLPALPRLMVAAHLGRLPLAAIGAELQAQLGAFVQATGRPPDFIDGHQHVHHLPGVRGLLLRALAALPAGTAVRSTAHLPGPGFAVKRWLIAHSGGRALRRALQRAGIAHNHVLVGAYDFAETAGSAEPAASDYRRLLQGWLAALPAAGGLLFCHPGAHGAAPDAIAAARVREAAYFGSTAFDDDLAAAGVVQGSAWRIGV